MFQIVPILIYLTEIEKKIFTKVKRKSFQGFIFLSRWSSFCNSPACPWQSSFIISLFFSRFPQPSDQFQLMRTPQAKDSNCWWALLEDPLFFTRTGKHTCIGITREAGTASADPVFIPIIFSIFNESHSLFFFLKKNWYFHICHWREPSNS